jgi:hypothetical protein
MTKPDPDNWLSGLVICWPYIIAAIEFLKSTDQHAN